jgi:hypothetical protein
VFESAIFCLALNVYFEARNEPVEGKVAVAQVVMNRKADPRFPDTICGVVYQGQKRKRDFFPIKNKCQFLVLRWQIRPTKKPEIFSQFCSYSKQSNQRQNS